MLVCVEVDRIALTLRRDQRRGAPHAAWFACAVIAHNLTRWAVMLGKHEPVNNRTLRTHIIAVPAVVVNRSGRHTLRLPARWPWQHDFTAMLTNLRALPGPAG